MLLNENNFSDFLIGYINNIVYTAELNPTNHTNSPLQSFKNNTTIQEIHFIEGTKFVYYNITEENTTYYGIIDILSNKTIFNTNESIEYFKPLSNSSMLAITNTSAFEICVIRKNGKCIYECDENESFEINTKGANYCKKQKEKTHDFTFTIPFYILYIILGMFVLMVIVIILLLLKKYSCKARRRDSFLVEMINRELRNDNDASNLD